MTLWQQIATIAIAAGGTMLTRYLPFVAFGGKRGAPAVVTYLGQALPGAIFAILVVYCLRNVDFAGGFHGAPELIAIAVVVVTHLWKRNMLLSIAAGTICYMLLVQLVFV